MAANLWEICRTLRTLPGVSPDIFRGTKAADRLVGSSGDDLIYGLAGRDLLDGRGGADRMDGGKGGDVYIVDNSHDRVIEKEHGGIDLVRSSVNFTLGANVEKLLLTGAAGLNGRGNALDNVLTGNHGDNRLWGGLGADRLTGGRGADTFLFRDAGESTVDPHGRDTIRDFSHRQHDRIDLHFIDADDKRNGNQAFTFIDTDAFHGRAGELRFDGRSGNALVQGDIDGDGKADFALLVHGTTSLRADDFIL